MATDHMGGGMTREQVEAYRKYQGGPDYDDPEYQARDYEDSIEGTVNRALAFSPTVVKVVVVGLIIAVVIGFAAPFFSLN